MLHTTLFNCYFIYLTIIRLPANIIIVNDNNMKLAALIAKTMQDSGLRSELKGARGELEEVTRLEQALTTGIVPSDMRL